MKKILILDGAIGDMPNWIAEDFNIIRYSDVTDMLTDLPDDITELEIHVKSPGGEVAEAFAIHDFIVTHAKDNNITLSTISEGAVASAGTILYLVAPNENRLVGINSTIMIHNPQGFKEGEAEEMKKYAEDLQKIEDQIIDFYVERTGLDKKKASELMAEETWINADEAIEMGFASKKTEPMKAFAFLKKEDPVWLKATDVIKAEMSKIVKMLKGDPTLLKVKTIDNKELEIKTDEKDNLMVKIGQQVQLEGKVAPDDTYLIVGGDKYTVAKGLIEKIEHPEIPTNNWEAKYNQLNTVFSDFQKSTEKQLTAIKDGITSQYHPEKRTIDPPTDPVVKDKHDVIKERRILNKQFKKKEITQKQYDEGIAELKNS